jgi:integrase
MARHTQRKRIYWRTQGGERRAWADFRDLGGKREPLRVPGERRATNDLRLAEVLCAQRLADLSKQHARNQERAIHGLLPQARLAKLVEEYLIARAKVGAVTDERIEAAQAYLARAIEFFGPRADLSQITTRDVRKWVENLKPRDNRRGERLSGRTLRYYLNALSHLYRWARGEGYVPQGYSPVSDLTEKPRVDEPEKIWLEVPEAALLLEAARTYRPAQDHAAITFSYPLLATLLLTGGRRSEVLGLEVGDVSFDRKTVTFRPNAWRRLKTKKSHRTIRLWPQLEEILRAYTFGANAPPGRLLFPSPSSRVTGEARLRDVRALIDAVTMHAGEFYLVEGTQRRRAEPGEIRTKAFRHTYASARLQTLDEGRPVSVYTVSKELGHSDTAMIERVYGHLGDIRHRADVVEFRAVQHGKQLGRRLVELHAREARAAR